MSLFKKLFYEFSSFFPMSFLQAASPVRTLLPYHHTVSNETLDHIIHLYCYKNEQQFESDLDVLLKNNSLISPVKLIELVKKGQPLPANTFLLSFDDGFREVYDVIAPILKRKGVPAIFFINPDFLDNKKLFYRCKISLLLGEFKNSKVSNGQLQEWKDILATKILAAGNFEADLKKVTQENAHLLDEMAAVIHYSFDDYLKTQRPFLTTSQVKSLHEDGFTIGAHSMSHPYYQLLPFEEQVNQTVDSVKYVNELLGINDTCFSFPHSDAGLSQSLIVELNKKNIPAFFGIRNQQEENSNKILHRFNAERPGINMQKQIKGIYFMLWIKHLTGTDKVKR